VGQPIPMCHEYVGVVEQVGASVRNLKPGGFVVGSFFSSDNTCEICGAGYQSSCLHGEYMGANGCQAELLRVHSRTGPWSRPPECLQWIRSRASWPPRTCGEPAGSVLLQLRTAAGRRSRCVGDGAVGLLSVLAAKKLGAERFIAVSRNDSRQRLAREFGATDIVPERGEEGVDRVKQLTDGLGAHSVIEGLDTQESMMRAIRPAVLAVTSATLASLTVWNCRVKGYSISTFTCMADRHPSVSTDLC
jgi:threonine dehydrogenase-like Zn-dependent dehydrogenase